MERICESLRLLARSQGFGHSCERSACRSSLKVVDRIRDVGLPLTEVKLGMESPLGQVLLSLRQLGGTSSFEFLSLV
jgi:hypothetical protein